MEIPIDGPPRLLLGREMRDVTEGSVLVSKTFQYEEG